MCIKGIIAPFNQKTVNVQVFALLHYLQSLLKMFHFFRVIVLKVITALNF